METKEKIEVFIDIENGNTVCICKRTRKGCKKFCEAAVVERISILGGKRHSGRTDMENAMA